jgi:hypothetical protein
LTRPHGARDGHFEELSIVPVFAIDRATRICKRQQARDLAASYDGGGFEQGVLQCW